MLKQSLISAYSTLVKKGTYILDETDRINASQKIVPEAYISAVAEYLVSK